MEVAGGTSLDYCHQRFLILLEIELRCDLLEAANGLIYVCERL